MAKVATARAPLPSNPLHYDGATVSKVTAAVKRKTPSELRGEQLKRKNIMELVDDSPDSVLCSMRNTNGVFCGIKKPDIPKNPKYIDTRMDELFPVKKNSIKLKLLSRKENIKENIPSEPVLSLKSSSTLDSTVGIRPQNSCLENAPASSSVKNDIRKETCSTTEKCGESTFRSVTELSLGGGISSGFSAVDMDKAFQGLVQEPPVVSASSAKSFERTNGSTSVNFISELFIPGRKIPLDVTLKTVMRVVSSSSVNRFHRSMTCGSFSDVEQFEHQDASFGGQNMTSLNSTNHIYSIKSAHSWVYPQSSLPPSVISALALAATEGGQMDFLSKRQLAWEDSFRNLYYMLRKNFCNIFYVCSAQFVVMFTSVDIFNEGKVVCNAYISQSTRSLRSMLKEHDISFSMPLSNSKVEQVTTEDLAELSEIEKHNLGQTRRLGSLSDGDNSPQSLLAFEGNGSVHGLYDLLLNYRFVLTSMTGMDVPILYSPVAFENASLSVPEIRCKEVRRADHMPVPRKENNMTDEPNQVSSSGFCYSIEIRDSYLPPWVIASLCNCLDASGSGYETSFVTEPTSVSLNVGLDVIFRKFDPNATENEGFKMNNFSFGIPNTIYSPQVRSAYLKGLKYCNGSYTASLSSV